MSAILPGLRRATNITDERIDQRLHEPGKVPIPFAAASESVHRSVAETAMTRPVAAVALLAVAAVLSACGGGGGGGGVSGGGGAAPTAAFGTTEYYAQAGLPLINASSAYARGGTGTGVIVAVLDGGLATTHPEFAGRIAAGGYDYVNSTSVITSLNAHGTHVSGIIAANNEGDVPPIVENRVAGVIG